MSAGGFARLFHYDSQRDAVLQRCPPAVIILGRDLGSLISIRMMMVVIPMSMRNFDPNLAERGFNFMDFAGQLETRDRMKPQSDGRGLGEDNPCQEVAVLGFGQHRKHDPWSTLLHHGRGQ